VRAIADWQVILLILLGFWDLVIAGEELIGEYSTTCAGFSTTTAGKRTEGKEG
jgi:hypothetical protein